MPEKFAGLERVTKREQRKPGQRIDALTLQIPLSCFPILPLPAMNIAVHIGSPLKERSQVYGAFVIEVFKRLTKQYPQHEFCFLYDQKGQENLISGKSIRVKQPPPIPMVGKFWYGRRIAQVLKKIKADVFVCAADNCCLSTTIPQCLVITDLPPNKTQASKRLSKHLQKAHVIATISEFFKDRIASQYAVDDQEITVVYSGPREFFHPMDFEDQSLVKEEFTKGIAYFICTEDVDTEYIITLLKAFSIFKKRQQSNMKLVLMQRPAYLNDGFNKILETYKYRADVVMAEPTEKNLERLVASAYAFIHPVHTGSSTMRITEAMKSGIPVLTSTEVKDKASSGALYFDRSDHQDVAEKMMLVYKDENLRSQLIEKGKLIASEYTWERTSGLMWECIQRAVAGWASLKSGFINQ